MGPPLQHPFGHEVASHTHAPVLVLHSSPVLHAAQATPPAPQDMLFSLPSASQVPLAQHPVHATPPHVHEPIEHDSLAAHDAHVAPPLPHEVPLCAAKGSHVPVAPPAQQPFGQEVASHTQAPALHSRPAPHDAHATPPLPQEVFVCDDCVTHAPFAQQPSAHVVALHGPCWSLRTSLGASDGTVPSPAPSPGEPSGVASGPPS